MLLLLFYAFEMNIVLKFYVAQVCHLVFIHRTISCKSSWDILTVLSSFLSWRRHCRDANMIDAFLGWLPWSRPPTFSLVCFPTRMFIVRMKRVLKAWEGRAVQRKDDTAWVFGLRQETLILTLAGKVLTLGVMLKGPEVSPWKYLHIYIYSCTIPDN